MRQTKQTKQNLLAVSDLPLEEERFEDILRSQNVRVERIISCGQASAPGFWYEQGEDEWVLIVKGSADVITKDSQNAETLWQLQPGDCLLLKAGQKHRVERTDKLTIWLAVFGTAIEEFPLNGNDH